MRKIILCFVFGFGILTYLCAQGSPSALNLIDLLKSGQVSLTTKGKGKSTGLVITGTLRNLTTSQLVVNIYMDQGLYLINSGTGQNMLATQVYIKEGMYSYDGVQSYIILPPQSNTEISFLAFCANLNKENPSPNESLTPGDMPSDINSIAAKINKYMKEHAADSTNVVACQIALWRAQGHSSNEILEHFKFTQNDLNNAHQLLNY